MPCYKPLEGWFGRELTRNGKRPVVFDHTKALDPDRPIKIACGRCIGCRADHARQWAVRAVHEAQLHPDNCFVTLTFNDASLATREAPPWSLDKAEIQRFMKRLRKRIAPRKVRYFGCGEYGEETGRPHYHVNLFGWTPPDRYLWSRRLDGKLGEIRYYRSPMLEQVWPYGHVVVGDVTFESARYVAGYVMKKIGGELAEAHYRVVDPETGEILGDRVPEFSLMSRRPAIGRDWLERYSGDVFPHDEVIMSGRPQKPPAYYLRAYEQFGDAEADLVEAVKAERVERMRERGEDSRLRLEQREQYRRAMLDRLQRGL